MSSNEKKRNYAKELQQRLRLYAVTDRGWIGVQTLLEQIESALVGGASAVQLREKELDRALFLREAREVKRLCRRFDVPFFINDDVDVAFECDADGVHLGQTDASPREARRRLGSDKIIGVSTHSVEEALDAERAGADYLGVGALFGSTTKNDTVVVTRETLSQICAAVSIPVIAIGGVNEDNMETLGGSGIVGVAVVSAIFAQPDVELATLALRTKSERLFGNSETPTI